MPLIPTFTGAVTGLQESEVQMDGHLVYHSLREPLALVSGALGPLRGQWWWWWWWCGGGGSLFCVVLERRLEQDIALPPYMKRIHHLSRHGMNNAQAVLGEAEMSGEQKIVCGISDPTCLKSDRLKRFFMARDFWIFNHEAVVTDWPCAAKLYSNGAADSILLQCVALLHFF